MRGVGKKNSTTYGNHATGSFEVTGEAKEVGFLARRNQDQYKKQGKTGRNWVQGLEGIGFKKRNMRDHRTKELGKSSRLE